MERWRGTSAALQIERVLSPERLSQLEKCIPGPGEEPLRRAMLDAARLGYDVSASVARVHGWDWPERLAGQVMVMLDRGQAGFQQRLREETEGV